MGYQKKCTLCKLYFNVEHAGRNMCEDCREKIKKAKKKRAKKMEKSRQINNPKGYNKVKKAVKVKAVVVKAEERNSNLMNGNPNGFNRYKKNPNPLEEIRTQLGEFREKSDIEQKRIVRELGNKVYMLKKEVRPLLMRFKKFRDYYEKKHFNWDWEDE